MDITALFNRATDDMEQLQGQVIQLELNYPLALTLLGFLQLALRHPGTADLPVSKLVTKFAHELQDKLSVTPALSVLCEMGWDPSYDF